MTECHARRAADPLTPALAIEHELDSSRASLPDFIPRSHKILVALLNSVRRPHARPVRDIRRMQPGRFDCEDLLRVDAQLRDLLARETRVSPEGITNEDLAEDIASGGPTHADLAENREARSKRQEKKFRI